MNTAAQNNPLSNQPDLNEILVSWTSPAYPFKKRNRIFYQTIAALTLLLVVIVFFLHEFLLIGVILSIAFVVYVISTIPPLETEHRITPLGFDNAGRMFRWIELHSFWFENKWEERVLVIQTRLPFPAQLRAVLREVDEKKLKEIIGKYLLFQEKPPKSLVDNFSEWLSKKIPFESES
ncbi:hypothetical protein MUP32_03375 [Candidatus Microgenomates bacterium]|nr:hypothetical protein [Candidatus Microgenomates bacterium]